MGPSVRPTLAASVDEGLLRRGREEHKGYKSFHGRLVVVLGRHDLLQVSTPAEHAAPSVCLRLFDGELAGAFRQFDGEDAVG